MFHTLTGKRTSSKRNKVKFYFWFSFALFHLFFHKHYYFYRDVKQKWPRQGILFFFFFAIAVDYFLCGKKRNNNV